MGVYQYTYHVCCIDIYLHVMIYSYTDVVPNTVTTTHDWSYCSGE